MFKQVKYMAKFDYVKSHSSVTEFGVVHETNSVLH